MHIQAYSEPYVNVAYSEPWHIWNFGILRYLPYTELNEYS